MKKRYVTPLALCFLLSTAFAYPTQTDEQKQCEVWECVGDNDIIVSNDELDNLVNTAIDIGVLSDKIKVRKLFKCEVFLRKTLIILLLKPYLYMADKYIVSKNWTAQTYKTSKNWIISKYIISKHWLTHNIQKVWKKYYQKECEPQTSEQK